MDDNDSALLNDSGEQTKERAIAKAEEVVNGLNNVVLNIAVTGETGAGKSSFVNAIRGVKVGEKGSAPIGVTECTTEVTMYPHPTMPNVRIWDLPGIGTPRFKAKTYLKDVKFKNYDFFIIVSAFRFKENDLTLAKEIKKQKKNFYFVRSKIDLDVRNEMENGRAEEEVLHHIREDCLRNLSELGPPPIFLITSKDLSKFDFQKLQETMESDLPSQKKDVIVLSLPVYSMQSLEKKYSTLKKAIWALAVVSGGIAVAPVPGLSFAIDTTMVGSFFTNCYFSFGLDDKTLRKLSDRVDKPILEEVKKSKLMQAIVNSSPLTTNMAAKLGAAGIAEALSSLVPIAGSAVAAGVSFLSTRSVLLEGLDELYRVAKKVIEMAGLQ
ncbi:hypothetical protein ACEWY4_026025 [Coilia grayii]|uniref:IRG-type G domain-containing protein n=1 Tax=Coilia grayii TaxID=363190 RepID=A0ABD1IVR4_9TELE